VSIKVTYSTSCAPIASRISTRNGQLRYAPGRALCSLGNTMLVSAHSASLSDAGGLSRSGNRPR
jgi:hypothetical protein